MDSISQGTLQQIEREHPRGMTSAEILDVFASHGIALSEATLRKYVQLGLLPRSVRVGRKGKHQGSQGLYPASVVRQILRIKEMMAQSLTMEQIQREFLFMRSDLAQLEQALESIFAKLDGVMKRRRREEHGKLVAREIRDARALGKSLVARLEGIESRLTSPTRIERVAAS